MFSSANRELNRKNQRAKHAAMDATLKAEAASEMNAAEEKARADAHVEAKRMEEEQAAKVEEPELTNATETATENATAVAPAAAPAAEATPVVPAKKPTPVAKAELAPSDADAAAEAKVESEEAKFPTDWIKNDVKFNVDDTKKTREDSIAEKVKNEMKWKTSTEGWFLQTKTFTLRPWGTPA